MEESKRMKNYNPADYAELEKQAKLMDKKELESFYVEKKDKAHTTTLQGIMIGLMIVLGLLVVVMMSGVLVSENMVEKLEDNVEILAEDICPIVEDYQLTLIEESNFWGSREITIDCQ